MAKFAFCPPHERSLVACTKDWKYTHYMAATTKRSGFAVIEALKASLRRDKHAYDEGIRNRNFAMLVGRLAAQWPHVEEKMITVLRDLIADHSAAPARQIFRAIVSESARIKVMQSLLEHSAFNADKGQFYNDVISEFGKLNRKRNELLHGLWWTRDDDRMWLSSKLLSDYHFSQAREVRASEVRDTLKKMTALLRRLNAYEERLNLQQARMTLQRLKGRKHTSAARK